MNHRLGLLGGILVVQLLIVAWLLIGGSAAEDQGGALLDVDAADIDSFAISDGTLQVTVRREGEGWQVGDWPADTTKAAELVSEFADMSVPWPVATTADSAARFEVTAEKFQRRIAFLSGDAAVATVFLGTSPGYQRVHARVDGSDDVFAIPFSNFKAPVAESDWMDKTLLASDGAVRSVVSSKGFELSRGDEGWLVDGEAADQDAAQAYLERFENLRVLNVVAELPEGVEDKGQLDLTDDAGGLQLAFLHAGEEDDYYVRSSRRDGVFEIATYIAEQLLADKDSLLPDVLDAPETLDVPEEETTEPAS